MRCFLRLFSSVFLCAFLIVGTTAAFPKKPRTPKLTATLEGNLVQLIIQKKTKAKVKLIIQRHSEFQKFKQILRAKFKGKLLNYSDDASGLQGKIYYRVKIKNKAGQSRWSKKIIVTTMNPVPTETPKYDTRCSIEALTQLIIATNEARIQNGLASVIENLQLGKAANEHSMVMANSQKLVHDNWVSEILSSGYSGRAMSQNIAKYISTPNEVVEGWLGSEFHRNNLLNPKWTEIGVGCAIDQNGVIWWTQNFGWPLL